MTAEIVERAKAERETRVRAVVGKLAHEVPELVDLDAATLEKVARVALLDEVKGKLQRAADLERIDYQAERQRFIERASRTGSERTRKLYSAALARLEAWCARQAISPLELTPARADDWIEAEKAEGRAPATVNLDVAAASAFWTWLERRHPELHNPFRGTRARPARKASRVLAVPSDKEITALLKAARPWLHAAIVVMARLGLRVGGLPGLTITGSRWVTTSKGKAHGGTISDSVRQAITRAGLPLRSPFGGYSAEKVRKAFEYIVRQLYAEGRIRARYSVHDLRHAFACREYLKDRDIYRVSKALGHAGVSVTERYLRSLNVLD